MNKKIISVILAMVMLLSTMPFVFAEEFITDDTSQLLEETDDVITDPVVDPTPDPEPEPEPKPVTDTTIVGKIYLCSSYNNIIPHVFVYVENTSDHNIQVGSYTCPPGEGVSMGSFGMTVSDGIGVYYNVEAYRLRDNHTNVMYISKNINNKELKALTSFAKNANFWDPLFVNCCYFAAKCWNEAGGSYFFPVTVLPWISRAMLKSRGAVYDLQMTIPEKNEVYRQKNGKLYVCSEGSLS